ncbi:hypothetical protein [Specibacter sp. RAF43]|uniref:hypothetical protein n=1 Tax=Specibacter sp. RAF43 TaxID=3233057 RepID=UPI003F9A18A0
MTSQPIDDSAGSAGQPAERRALTVRRAPKFVPFMIAGAIVGVIAAALFALLGPGGAEFDRSSVFGFLTVLLLIPGAGLGAIAALVLDRRSLRRSRRAVVESVPEQDPGTAPEDEA